MQDNWNTLRAQLERFSKPFPREAIAFAHAHQQELAPHLIEVLAQVAADPSITDEPDYVLHEYALHLLAAWADPRAYAPMVAMGHMDEDTLEGVLGDTVTETYGRCLATVCDGDLTPLKALFEDEKASHWARGAALDAMVVRVMEGCDSRDALIDYLTQQGDQHAQRLRASDAQTSSLELIDCIVRVACDLAAVELHERINSWFDDGLLDVTYVSQPEVASAMGESFESLRQSLLAHRKGFVRDVEAEMGWWAWFRDEPVAAKEPSPWLNLAGSAQASKPWPPEPLQPIETVVRASPKVGRNDTCPCGSGKKYKKCCGAG